MGAIQAAILSELRRRKKSVYEFAKGLKASKTMHSITAMKWFYSGRHVSVGTVEKMLKALDLVVVPRKSVAKERHA